MDIIQGEFSEQRGGYGQFAIVRLEIEAAETTKFDFNNFKSSEGSGPHIWISAAQYGAEYALQKFKYVDGLSVKLIDLKGSSMDTNPTAVAIASFKAISTFIGREFSPRERNEISRFTMATRTEEWTERMPDFTTLELD